MRTVAEAKLNKSTRPHKLSLSRKEGKNHHKIPEKYSVLQRKAFDPRTEDEAYITLKIRTFKL